MDQRVIALYNDYVHGSMPRRHFLARLAGILGSAAAVSAVLPLIEPNYVQAQQVAPDDKRIVTEYAKYKGTQSDVRAFVAKPAGAKGKLPGVVVIHENRGLNAHIEDVARRTALAGYVAVAPDGLSVAGGAPTDQEQARDLFGKTDAMVIATDVLAAVPYLASRADANGKIGVVGFCYGGSMSLQAAVHRAETTASVCFYGGAPKPEDIAKIKAPLCLHYAGSDERVNAGIADFRKSLDEHGVAYSLNMYPGTQHGFHNDSSAARYNEAAAKLAWARTLAFFEQYLKAG